MRVTLTFVSILMLASCAGSAMQELPMIEADMPLTFAPQEVTGAEPKFERAFDDRNGIDVRRLVVNSPRSVAVMTYQSVVGDFVFSPATLQETLGRMLKDNVEVTWGDSGSTRQGGIQTEWQAFQLKPGSLGCMGLQRELSHHAEVGNVPNTAQAVAAGFLCRDGGPMTEADASRLAAELRAKT